VPGQAAELGSECADLPVEPPSSDDTIELLLELESVVRLGILFWHFQLQPRRRFELFPLISSGVI